MQDNGNGAETVQVPSKPEQAPEIIQEGYDPPPILPKPEPNVPPKED